MSEELKPCPFCGERPTLVEKANGRGFVHCDCGINSRIYFHRADGIEHWNRRADQQNLVNPYATDEQCESCHLCGRPYAFVYRVPNAVWHKISPSADAGGLLCPACADRVAREAGIALFWEAAEGTEFPTERIRRETVERCIKAIDKLRLVAGGGAVKVCLIHGYNLGIENARAALAKEEKP